MAKHVFITGGVVSSLGKGITAASLGRLLKNRGLKVYLQKFDPYINVDPGQMSPYQHGEVYVTDDGVELPPGNGTIVIDGVKYRLSPIAQFRNEKNLIVLSMTIQGNKDIEIGRAHV